MSIYAQQKIFITHKQFLFAGKMFIKLENLFASRPDSHRAIQ